MTVNFSLKSLLKRLPERKAGIGRDPRVLMRVVLGVLLVANIIAVLLLVRPWAPSVEEMAVEVSQLKSQVRQKQASVERLRVLAGKAERAREEGDAFMKQYFLSRRTASSTIIAELKQLAQNAGIKQQDQTFSFEPIEGSDTLSLMTISGNYEGTYSNFVKFIHLVDISPRFLILDTLTAAPEQNAGVLNMNLKMNAIVMESTEGEQKAGKDQPAPVKPEQAGGGKGQAAG